MGAFFIVEEVHLAVAREQPERNPVAVTSMSKQGKRDIDARSTPLKKHAMLGPGKVGVDP